VAKLRAKLIPILVPIFKRFNIIPGRYSNLIEMEIGSEPEMGRIGYETTILLFETDIILLGDYHLGA